MIQRETAVGICAPPEQTQTVIPCIHYKDGKCVARRECSRIIFYTRRTDDPDVRRGNQIAQGIVQNGATFETKTGLCNAPSQQEAEAHCNGFIPLLPQIQSIH